MFALPGKAGPAASVLVWLRVYGECQYQVLSRCIGVRGDVVVSRLRAFCRSLSEGAEVKGRHRYNVCFTFCGCLMCGIVGAIAGRDVVPVLIEGLKRLEYRGYDSSGIAVLESGSIRRVRRTGRVAEMAVAATQEGFTASLGIGHTRWATHGE